MSGFGTLNIQGKEPKSFSWRTDRKGERATVSKEEGVPDPTGKDMREMLRLGESISAEQILIQLPLIRQLPHDHQHHALLVPSLPSRRLRTRDTRPGSRFHILARPTLYSLLDERCGSAEGAGGKDAVEEGTEVFHGDIHLGRELVSGFDEALAEEPELGSLFGVGSGGGCSGPVSAVLGKCQKERQSEHMGRR
jgi:hypothetical protein